ncbi:MAG: helix-turn-helix domain-containing protein [Bacteroidales bacterium]
MEYIENPQLRQAFDFVQFTGKNIFLTGKAGTGKTTFLKHIKEVSPKRMIVVAPTGVAAINAGGVTIHSFFQMPFGPLVPATTNQYNPFDEEQQSSSSGRVQKFSREKINIIKSLDLLVIDEISMVRADLLDGIDEVLRRFRNHSKPFGGVQLLMIGDIQQLAPIAKDDEWNILKRYYNTVYFFSSKALQKTPYVSIELKHIYRQSDREFIDILNKVRENKIDTETLGLLNKRYIPNINSNDNDGYITLTTHNHQSQKINDSKLQKVKSQLYTFKASVKGEFPEYSYPTDYELQLKVGAQVMFVKNDTSFEKLYYNGKIGTIVDIDEDIIHVKCNEDSSDIAVTMVEWQNYKYSINEETSEISETEIGSFTQYPLKLAWAITIHKSQGLTFEKAIIDASSAFAHGQVYVALSRCKTIEGIILSSPLSTQCIRNDSTVLEFSRNVEQNPPTTAILTAAKIEYQQQLVTELFDFNAIQRRLNYSIKLLKENSSIVFGDIHEQFEQMLALLKSDIMDVNDRFYIQLQQLFRMNTDIEKNEELQDRISKGSTYYGSKVETIFTPIINKISIETDNKAVRKAITTAIDKLLTEVTIKLACLYACKTEFNVKNYIDTKAKASIEKPASKPAKQKTEHTEVSTTTNQMLADRLKAWRTEKFNSLNVPAYVVLPQKALIELANHLPCTPAQLKAIKGFGKTRIVQFGEEILDIIINYRNENGINTESQLFMKSDSPKKEKVDTKQTSFEMFMAGMSIEMIAKERQMAVTTIEGHIAHYVKTGAIDIQRLVSPHKVEIISNYLLNADNLMLGPAKEAIGNEVSYNEIRMVLSHLQYKGMVKAN